MVRANGAVSLRELARVVQTSEVTVRRDVRALEAEGLLDRRHGGAVLPGGLTRDAAYPPTTSSALAEKNAIADVAASLVHENDTVMIGAGTTTLEFARRLARIPGLTVVTNSLLIAQALAHANRVEVVMTGGTVNQGSNALVGSEAEMALSELRASKAFVSGVGLTAARGLSSSSMLSASVDKAMVASTLEVIVLADHTKVGTDSMFQTVPAEAITRLVTDSATSELTAHELDALADCGVQISIAPLGPPADAHQQAAPANAASRRPATFPGQRRPPYPTPAHRRHGGTSQG